MTACKPLPQTLFTVTQEMASCIPAPRCNLPGGVLAATGLQDLADEYFVKGLWVGLGVSDQGLANLRADFRGGQLGERAQETTDRAAFARYQIRLCV